MTQIKGFVEATRRPGVLGVHSLDHFSLTVPDLAPAKLFYESFGLDVRREGNGLALYTAGHPHCWGLLSEGPKKKLHYLSFGAFEDDLPRFRERLAELNIERLPPPPASKATGSGFAITRGRPWRFASPRSRRPQRSRPSPLFPRRRASMAPSRGRRRR
jgi:catechol 2,3-dioxygenase-like lactoylglutathione lyase family enzyme